MNTAAIHSCGASPASPADTIGVDHISGQHRDALHVHDVVWPESFRALDAHCSNSRGERVHGFSVLAPRPAAGVYRAIFP